MSIFYKNDKNEYHRDGGLPAVDRIDGSKEWWVHGELHRDGGLPAIELPDGRKEWWVGGHYHRDGGLPAIELPDGRKEWWINGKHVSEKYAVFVHKRKMKTVKTIARLWYDITYQNNKQAYYDRMYRDMDLLENEIGYELN